LQRATRSLTTQLEREFGSDESHRRAIELSISAAVDFCRQMVVASQQLRAQDKQPDITAP
jgi:hypothetical protein